MKNKKKITMWIIMWRVLQFSDLADITILFRVENKLVSMQRQAESKYWILSCCIINSTVCHTWRYPRVENKNTRDETVRQLIPGLVRFSSSKRYGLSTPYLRMHGWKSQIYFWNRAQLKRLMLLRFLCRDGGASEGAYANAWAFGS